MTTPAIGERVVTGRSSE